MKNQSKFNRYLIGSLLVLVLFIGLTSLAQAAPAPANILDQVAQTFHTTVQTWGAKATGYAERLFLGLAIIGLIWDCGWLALQREDIGAFFSTFIRWIVFVGFFWWLTQWAAAMATAIFSSFQTIGADIGGVSGGTLGPSTPINIALQIDVATGNAMSVVHPINSIALAMVDLTILISMCVVAANMLITLCSAWVMAYAGCVLVGFGAVKWTSDIAINYFRTVLGVAVTYMTMLLLIGLSQQFFNLLLSEISQGTATMQSLMVMASVAIVLAFLIHKLPPLVGSITGNNGGAHGSFGIGAAIGAAAAVGAAVATGGAAMAAGGAASAAGGAAGAAGGGGGGGALGPLMNAVRGGSEASGGMSGGDGASMADGFGAANDADAGAGGSPLAEAMGEPASPRSSSAGSMASGARSFGRVVAAVAHAGVSAMDNAVGGSGYNGALAPGAGGGQSSSTPQAPQTPAMAGESVPPPTSDSSSTAQDMPPDSPMPPSPGPAPTPAPSSSSMGATVHASQAQQRSTAIPDAPAEVAAFVKNQQPPV